jgi:hypothetical protein
VRLQVLSLFQLCQATIEAFGRNKSGIRYVPEVAYSMQHSATVHNLACHTATRMECDAMSKGPGPSCQTVAQPTLAPKWLEVQPSFFHIGTSAHSCITQSDHLPRYLISQDARSIQICGRFVKMLRSRVSNQHHESPFTLFFRLDLSTSCVSHIYHTS